MPDSPPTTAEEYRKAQATEWGTYVALVPIDIDGARAFNPGDPVPASHVTASLVDEGQVAKTTTKAGQSAAAAVTDTPKG
jgi:hypothetical protein